MNEVVKAEWVEALRSGDIPQGKSYLGTTGGKRCCLGVLSDIAVQHGIIEAPYVLNDDGILCYGNDTETLPIEVMEWAGLEDCNPDVMDRDDGTSLAEANDDGTTFAQIADIIESQL